ncbi:hypothetical protein WJX84_011508 [Apatococcus fuscideae]|uniref:Uncharacterized protein n=1 Tax=Apatococcus fuscideae TaxID=2026836 RepID=A0AAW1T7T3_9CHLO
MAALVPLTRSYQHEDHVPSLESLLRPSLPPTRLKEAYRVELTSQTSGSLFAFSSTHHHLEVSQSLGPTPELPQTRSQLAEAHKQSPSEFQPY